MYYGGQGQFLSITHIGDAKIGTSDNYKLLRDVLLVPNIKKDLFSVSQLTTDYPYDFLFIFIVFFFYQR